MNKIDDKFAVVLHFTPIGANRMITVENYEDFSFLSGVYHMRNAMFWEGSTIWRTGNFEVPVHAVHFIQVAEYPTYIKDFDS